MYIAKKQISYKNEITKKGEIFKCDDEEVIKKLKKSKSIGLVRKSRKK